MSLVRQAYDHGRQSRESCFQRVSPFYNERVVMRGKMVDITPMLDQFWLAGYDGEPYPEPNNAVDSKRDEIPTIVRLTANA